MTGMDVDQAIASFELDILFSVTFWSFEEPQTLRRSRLVIPAKSRPIIDSLIFALLEHLLDSITELRSHSFPEVSKGACKSKRFDSLRPFLFSLFPNRIAQPFLDGLINHNPPLHASFFIPRSLLKSCMLSQHT
jgi:hypothetical protein